MTVGYGYDGLGQRVRKRVGGADTGYLYDGINLLYELGANGAVTAKYTYYPGSLQPHSVVRNGVTYYYATDTQGSVLALFNASNQIMNQYRYLPFGEAQSATQTIPNRIRYAGRELEDESGLYYNNARWYDPTLHRFVSQDPIGIEGGINLYAYTGNDPVDFIDPSGLERCVPLYQHWQEVVKETRTGRIIRTRRWTTRVGEFCYDERHPPTQQQYNARMSVAGAARSSARVSSVPECTYGATSLLPRGGGFWLAAGGQAGIGDGIAATASVTSATYIGEGHVINHGTFATAGGVLNFLGSAIEAPGGVTSHHASVIGISAPSMSGGVMFSNTHSSKGHTGLFDNMNLSVAWFNGTISWDPHGNAYQVNLGLNIEPAHFAFNRFYTNTWNSVSAGCSGR